MKCLVYLAEGFEECEALITVDLLRRGNVAVDTASIANTEMVKSSHNIEVKADYKLNEVDPESYDVLIMPGGKLGTANLEACEEVTSAYRKHYDSGKLTCAICAAPSILGHMGILKGKKYTCFPSFDEDSFEGEYQKTSAVKDGNVITGRGMGATIEFARLILKELIGEDGLKDVENGIQYVSPKE